MTENLVKLAYVVGACLFIVGLKMLSSPRTAPRGNMLAALGMLTAIVAALFEREVLGWTEILVGVVIGSAIGAVAAQTVKMTAMPQMVALFNGFGGAASAVVAASEVSATETALAPMISVPVVLSMLIGGLTFTGSLIAFGKLQGLVAGQPIVYPLQKTANALLLAGTVALGVLFVLDPAGAWLSENGMPDWLWFVGLTAISLLLGVLSVIPIGGADMPVVISLLNSYSGLAACATGFVLQNNALIIGGSLVGASGIILTQIMCKAMNRSLANVLFGAFGTGDVAAVAGAGAGASDKVAKSASPEEAAMILDGASLVVFVPGYGMAVAQAQHQVRELDALLQKRGIEVIYGIHPVAGRMPGHMNVLLAEADVPYDQLLEMETVNPRLPQTDVAIVIGANDVTNPAALDDPSSPIYGMPILEVDKARTVFVLKRSLNPGFAGVDNPLFYRDNTLMIFGDAKDTITKLVQAVKEV